MSFYVWAYNKVSSSFAYCMITPHRNSTHAKILDKISTSEIFPFKLKFLKFFLIEMFVQYMFCIVWHEQNSLAPYEIIPI